MDGTTMMNGTTIKAKSPAKHCFAGLYLCLVGQSSETHRGAAGRNYWITQHMKLINMF
jgi:hypothetical protein